MKKLSVLTIVSLLFSVLILPAPVEASGNLVNLGFETGNLSGWTIEEAVNSVRVVRNDYFYTYSSGGGPLIGVSPREGTYMARLGKAGAWLPPGNNTISQVFTVTEPTLNFSYNLFSYDYSPFDLFEYKVTVADMSGTVVAQYSQGSGSPSGGSVWSSGWQDRSIDLSDRIGQELKFSITAGGTRDWNLSTWAYIDSSAIPPDVTAPTTSADATPAANPAGWNNTPVTLTLSANDNPGGTGAKAVHYQIGTGSEVVVPGGMAKAIVRDEGSVAVRYWALDNAGNVSEKKTLTLRIDQTTPTIELTSPLSGNFLTTDRISVAYTAFDALSGLDSQSATFDGTAVQNGQSVSLGALAGNHQLIVTARDKAGNEATREVSLVVRIAATLDLNPESLNLASKADKSAFTAHIELPAGYDVSQIDTSTVYLTINGHRVRAQATPKSIGDYDADGVPDLMVKFDRQSVIDAIGGAKGNVAVAVDGSLANALRFTGGDTLRVIGK